VNEYFFPAGTILAPDARLVLAEDIIKFNLQHPGVAAIGPLDFEFSNATETLSVINDGLQTVVALTYDDAQPWPAAADGYGRTMEIKDANADPGTPESWFAGCIGGSPGSAYTPCPEQIIFTEINYKSSDAADAGDGIELYNGGTTAADLSGWTFSDDDDDHLFVIPSGTIVPPSGYFVFFNDSDKFNARFPAVTNSDGPFDFGLGSGGDALRLYDASGLLYQSMVYGTESPWPMGAAGNGYTLQIVDANGNCCDAANWIDGCLEGTPGRPYVFPCDLTSTGYVDVSTYFKIHPNPSTGKFLITPSENGMEITGAEVEIFNSVGKKVYSTGKRYLENTFEIELRDVPDGVYMARIRMQEKLFTMKLVIAERGR
jgi:hypothetical protein